MRTSRNNIGHGHIGTHDPCKQQASSRILYRKVMVIYSLLGFISISYWMVGKSGEGRQIGSKDYGRYWPWRWREGGWDGLMNGWMYGCMNVWMSGWVSEWVSEWVDWWVDACEHLLMLMLALLLSLDTRIMHSRSAYRIPSSHVLFTQLSNERRLSSTFKFRTSSGNYR